MNCHCINVQYDLTMTVSFLFTNLISATKTEFNHIWGIFFYTFEIYILWL